MNLNASVMSLVPYVQAVMLSPFIAMAMATATHADTIGEAS